LAVCPIFAQPAAEPNALLQGLELYRRGECAAALPLLDGLLQRQPKNTAVRKLVASCLSRLNRPAEARAQYEAILKISPGDADAVRALNPPPPPKPQAKPAPAPPLSTEARERLEAGKDLDFAERLIKAERFDEAELVLSGLMQRLPHLALPVQRQAELHTLNKRYDRAAELYRSLAARPDAEPVWLLRAAQNYSWHGDHGEAVSHYRMYLGRNPADADALLGLANALLWSDKHEDAVTSYRAYLNLKPDDNEARMNMARALMWSEHYAEAIEELRALQRRRPGDENTALSLAQCYEQAAKFDEALAAYDGVLKLNPESAVAAQSRERLVTERPRREAALHMEKGDFDKAAVLLLGYLERHPESTETVLQLARSYNWSERYREAAGYYEQYLAQKPNDETARRELARLIMIVQEFDVE
jgi:tetratricopeptide (TPR) repeat protein